MVDPATAIFDPYCQTDSEFVFDDRCVDDEFALLADLTFRDGVEFTFDLAFDLIEHRIGRDVANDTPSGPLAVECALRPLEDFHTFKIEGHRAELVIAAE